MTSFTLTDLRNLHLASHPTARNQAIASVLLKAGTSVISVPSFTTSLLLSEKGKRCDNCHRQSTSEHKLRKCSGCAAFWYCGVQCQTGAWHAHHKHICKFYDRYVASAGYQTLSDHDRVDALLLSQLIAQNVSAPASPASEVAKAFTTFLDLVPSPTTVVSTPPLCRAPNSAPMSSAVIEDLYARFGNNNFVLHSHLASYAHGIFPLASRLFNHSCIPNAVTKFIITPSKPVRMEVVALRDIAKGEEVTIPYLDPALPLQIRQQALQTNYNFACHCAFCTAQMQVGEVSRPPEDANTLSALESNLVAYAYGNDGNQLLAPTSSHLLTEIPADLHPLFHETYLPNLSEIFSKTSHEGSYETAVSAGRTLLALYLLLYPPNYPQIGMHALELAKTTWNATLSSENGEISQGLEQTMELYLNIASQVLENFAQEGDDGGPLAEIVLLRNLLRAG